MAHLTALPGGRNCPSWCDRAHPHSAHQAHFGSATVTQLPGHTPTLLIDHVGPFDPDTVGQLIVDLNIALDAMADG